MHSKNCYTNTNKIVKRAVLTILLVLIQQNSVAQNNEKQLQDQRITAIYEKFSESRHSEARDTILNRFKMLLLKSLANKLYAAFPFDSLANKITIISSKDKKLRIFSWNEFSGGTWHAYNSAYQLNLENSSYSGFLTSESDSIGTLLFDDIIHYKIQKIEKNQYLVKGYGTHGHGFDFYTFRLFSFKNGIVTDCDKCFDGKDRLVFNKPRAFDISSVYNLETQEISYPEMKTSYFEGEDSGFTEPSGKILKLKYKNGVFIKL